MLNWCLDIMGKQIMRIFIARYVMVGGQILLIMSATEDVYVVTDLLQRRMWVNFYNNTKLIIYRNIHFLNVEISDLCHLIFI